MDTLDREGGNRLVWTALMSGFSLSTIIGGALYVQMTNWITHIEVDTADTAREVARRAQISEGAIAEFRGADKAFEALLQGHDRYHVLLEDRVRRNETLIDDLRRRIEELHDGKPKPGGVLDFEPTLDPTLARDG